MFHQRMVGIVGIALTTLCCTARADEYFIPDTGNTNNLNTDVLVRIGHFNIPQQLQETDQDYDEEEESSSTEYVSGTAGSADAISQVTVGPYYGSTLSVAGEQTLTILDNGFGGVRGRTEANLWGDVYGIIASDMLDPETPVDLLVTVTMEWSHSNTGATLNHSGAYDVLDNQYVMTEINGVYTDTLGMGGLNADNDTFEQTDYLVSGFYRVGDPVHLQFAMSSDFTDAVASGGAIVAFTIDVTIVEP